MLALEKRMLTARKALKVPGNVENQPKSKLEGSVLLNGRFSRHPQVPVNQDNIV
jgi:hypothetical protein